MVKGHEMIEVELKARVEDHNTLVSKLKGFGAIFIRKEIQQDLYFNAPQRDFRKTGEVLRLRNIGEHSEAILTYKSAPLESIKGSKARTEIESNITPLLSNLQNHIGILEALGFKLTLQVKKHRTIYSLNEIFIELDSIEELGLFIEIGMIVRKKEASFANETVLFHFKKLGLKEHEIVHETYFELLSNYQK
jgi:adenylate cyclase class 2